MKSLLLALLLSGCATDACAPEIPPTPFMRACAAVESHCNFAPPIVVRSQLVDDLFCFMCSYRGLTYQGEPYVFVNSTITPLEQDYTEFHETVHYTVFQSGMDLDRCENEELARKLTALEFNLPYDDDWRKGYRCEVA